MTEVTKEAAGKKVKRSLTDLERIVFDRCKETGDDPVTALRRDRVLHRKITDFATGQVRHARIQERLDDEILWVKHQVAKLKAGVREPEDEPRIEQANHENQEEAIRRMQSGSDELHGQEETVDA